MHFRSLRLSVVSALSTVPTMLNVLFLSLVFVLALGVVSLHLFAGRLHRCYGQDPLKYLALDREECLGGW